MQQRPDTHGQKCLMMCAASFQNVRYIHGAPDRNNLMNEGINPCAAGAAYILSQANFRLNKTPLKFVAYFVVDDQLFK